MSKRKRDDEPESGAVKIHKDYRKLRQIVGAFNESSEQLAKAFKTARGFERQKLGRRRKNAAAQKDDKDVERIDAEVAALKTLDVTTAAQHHLAKSLLKIKAVAKCLELPVEISKPKALPSDAPSLNVNARLCNSNPVKEVFAPAMTRVKAVFGIVDEVAAPAKKKRLRAKDYDNAAAGEKAEVKAAAVDTQKEDDIEAMAESDEQSDDEMDDYRGRLASSDDESDMAETSDFEELERMLAEEEQSRKPSSTNKYDPAADLSLDDASSQSDLEGEVEKARPTKAATTAIKKSAFIPSLSMGGYISGSGSDLDDDLDIAPKKNRRGQRARQAIWEKKFGIKAKHVKTQDRNQGWDAKRGAVGGRDERPHRFANAANAQPLGPRKGEVKKPKERDDTGPLHPSWEAAKKAKEKKAVPVVFSGKKISFD
ncbi:cellular morphogenesis protein Bud22 [Zymoseptoria brevis]|uniref:Cellular morphogenesis protein Bud22 n=1 Tax=Zymoseptoria brevis TaxID=1047168 RepID=A0A0F4GZD1_9PEZI|nr:cellular morphogenesis protein Bud22 [Zymoseptoria brevis]